MTTESERVGAVVAAIDECRVGGNGDDVVNKEGPATSFCFDESVVGDGAVVALSPRSSKDGIVPALGRVAWA